MGNPGYGGVVLQALLDSGAHVVGAFHQSRKPSHWIRKRYRRYLTSPKKRRELAQRIRQRIATWRDEPDTRPGFGRDVIEVAREAAIPLFDGSFVHHADCSSTLRQLGVDVILVATFGEILSQAVINQARIAAINMHPSLLPRYRGGFPEFSAIYHGERQSGVTYHLMEEKFDTGAILLQRSLSIGSDETTLGLKTRLAELAASLIPELLDLVHGHRIAGKLQDAAQATYCRLAPGFDEIRPDQTTDQVRRLINACYDVEDIGRPWVRLGNKRIWPLSCGPAGLPFRTADGMVHFDAVRYRHRIYRDEALSRLSRELGLSLYQ
jgi:methionyl-tRNA formyltransferase